MSCNLSLFRAVALAAVLLVPAVHAAGTDAADQAFKAGDWAAAEKAYLAARDTAGQRAADLAAAAGFFAETTRTTALLPETDANGLFDISLKNGKTLRGKLDRDASDATQTVFLKDGGARQVFRPRDIVRQVPVPQATRDREMLADLETRHAAVKDSVGMYFCGVKALEYNQKDFAKRCFTEAAAQDSRIRTTVREFIAANLFSQAFLARNLKQLPKANRLFREMREKYPDCAATALIDQSIKDADALQAAIEQRRKEQAALLKMKQKEAAAARAEMRRKRREANKDLADIEDEIDDAAEALGGGAPDIKKADELAAKADRLMKDASTGSSRDEKNRCFREAMAALKEAAALYRKSQDGKSDPAIDRKLNEAQQKIYWCRKMQTL